MGETETVDDRADGVQPAEADFRTRRYNILVSLIAALYFGVVLVQNARELADVIREGSGDHGTGAHVAEVAAGVATLAFLALVTLLFVIRRQPVNRAAGLQPRLVALLGTFLLTLLTLGDSTDPSLTSALIGFVLVAGGTLFAAYSLLYLGRSFSIMAEARALVTCGPYRLVRHPVYLAEEIAALGLVVVTATWWAILVLVAQLAFQIGRTYYEERVLSESFPEYDAYAAQTSRLIPGLY